MSKKNSVKACPFCGVRPQYKEFVAKMVDGHPLIQVYVHPDNDCYLSRCEICLDEIPAWNERV